MKKVFIAMLLVLALIAPMFAQGGEETKKATFDKDAPVKIVFWTHEDTSRNVLENRYLEEFKALHPNVEIEVSRFAAEPLRQGLQTSYAAGNAPTVWNLPIENAYQYIEAGLVAPVDYDAVGFEDAEDLYDYYLAGTVDAVYKNGDYYGLPLELTNWCIYINKQVFRTAGLDPETDYPRTWEDMVEVSKQIVLRDGDIIMRRGFDFRYSYSLIYFVPMVEQLGGSLSETEGCVNSEAWISALTFMKNWGPGGENLGNSTLTAPRKLFNKNNGDVAMALTGLYQEARIAAENPSFYNSGDWMVVPFPVFEDAVNDVAGIFYGHYYHVNANATEAQQYWGWKLIQYLLLKSGHAEEYLTQVGLIQPSKSLFESSTYKSMPYSEVFKADFEKSHITYHEKNASAIQTAIDTAINNVMLQGVDPEDAYETLQANVLALIAN